jgi:hypothetical protein
MIRTVWLWIMTAAAMAAAQDKPPDPLAALEQAAERRTSEWDTLAKGLELRISRLLPCDPRVRSAIEEVGRASDLRLVALQQYFQAAVARAKDQTEAVKRLLASQEALGKDADADRTDAEQEGAGIEGQLVNLAESVRRRVALAEAQQALEGLREMTRQRGAQNERRQDQAAALGTMLAAMVAAYQSRQAALEGEMSAMSAEGTRWSAYYAARLARADTECSITNPDAQARPRPRPPQQKKGKQ